MFSENSWAKEKNQKRYYKIFGAKKKKGRRGNTPSQLPSLEEARKKSKLSSN